MLQVIKKADMAQRAVRENEALKAENAELKAQLDYLAMMTNIELDGEDEGNEEV